MNKKKIEEDAYLAYLRNINALCSEEEKRARAAGGVLHEFHLGRLEVAQACLSNYVYFLNQKKRKEKRKNGH